MIEVIINPEGMEEIYLKYLNQCFGDWGGKDMYKWCFDRQVGGPKADIMLLKKAGVILGGSAVTYRKAIIRNSLVNVAIMTGSWTLPEARRQGCFTRIIEESIALAKGKGAALLLAFVTNKNASLKRLVDKGSSLFPTHYLVSGGNTLEPGSNLDVSMAADAEECAGKIFGVITGGHAGSTHFAYTMEEWRSQFIDRPEEIELVSVGATCLAIIEKKGIFDRVLAMSPGEGLSFEDCLKALLKRTLGNRRRLFLLTTSASWKDETVKLGFEHIPGFLTTLITNEDALRKLYPEERGGEQIIAQDLYDPSSKWYLGPWNLQTGDRM